CLPERGTGPGRWSTCAAPSTSTPPTRRCGSAWKNCCGRRTGNRRIATKNTKRHKKEEKATADGAAACGRRITLNERHHPPARRAGRGANPLLGPGAWVRCRLTGVLLFFFLFVSFVFFVAVAPLNRPRRRRGETPPTAVPRPSAHAPVPAGAAGVAGAAT